VRGGGGRQPVVVPLPSPVRRPAAAGAAPHRAGPGRRAAPGRRGVVRRARVPGGGGPARPGRPGLGAGRPAARRQLAGPVPGRAATVHGLWAGFPAGARAADAELAAVTAGDELTGGWLEAAERHLGLAERAPVPEGRRGQAQLLVGMVRLLLARQRANLPAVG